MAQPTVPVRSGPRRTQQERRDATEAALLAAAADLVVEGGLPSLTLARVGERAGYSRGIVTHHFGSKQALLEAVARAAQSRVAPPVDAPPGLGRLLLVIDAYLSVLGDDDAGGKAFLLLWVAAATTPELAPIARERDAFFRETLAADVAAGLASGTVRDGVDPSGVAVAVLAQLRGIGLQRLVDREVVDVGRLRNGVVEQWRRALTA